MHSHHFCSEVQPSIDKSVHTYISRALCELVFLRGNLELSPYICLLKCVWTDLSYFQIHQHEAYQCEHISYQHHKTPLQAHLFDYYIVKILPTLFAYMPQVLQWDMIGDRLQGT